MKFNELKQFYSDNFSLGYLNGNTKRSAIENRLVLICLIDYVVFKQKQKKSRCYSL